MIAPLRRRHRLFFVVLALVTAPILTLALMDRPEFPDQPLPEGALASAPGDLGDEQRPFEGLGAVVRTSPDRLWLRLDEPLRKPDVLLYWSAEPGAGSSLPADAFLLGPVSSTRENLFDLPASATGDGHLVLYSLGHQEVVAAGAVTGGGA